MSGNFFQALVFTIFLKEYEIVGQIINALVSILSLLFEAKPLLFSILFFYAVALANSSL